MVDESRLVSIEKKLDKLTETMQKIGVQDERLRQNEKDIGELWDRWDTLVAPGRGTLAKIADFQARCPGPDLKVKIKTVEENIGGKIKWVWVIVIPLCFLMLAAAFTLIRITI